MEAPQAVLDLPERGSRALDRDEPARMRPGLKAFPRGVVRRDDPLAARPP
jgi:hypothetical protein